MSYGGSLICTNIDKEGTEKRKDRREAVCLSSSNQYVLQERTRNRWFTVKPDFSAIPSPIRPGRFLPPIDTGKWKSPPADKTGRHGYSLIDMER